MPDTARRLRILIVEDNRDAADTLAFLTEIWGYQVRVAYDGPSGLAEAQRFQPECVISDINMPGMDGYALARQLRGEPATQAVKLVALSAYSHDDHVRKVLEAGFDFRLTKPAAAEEIHGVLQMIEQIKDLAAETKELARQNVTLAAEAKELLQGVKEDLKDVKEEVKELKEEVKDLKHALGEAA